MSVVERFIRERPIQFDEAMDASPREHLIEFWNWLDDEGYLSSLPPETGAKVRTLVRAADQSASQMAHAIRSAIVGDPTHGRSDEFRAVYKALEDALEPFKPLLENRDAAAKESSPGSDPGTPQGP